MNEDVFQALQNFRPRAEDAWKFEHPVLRAMMEGQMRMFPAFALPSPENPAAICGIVGAAGCAEVWMIVGENFRRAAPVVRQLQQQLCETFYAAWNLHRLELRVVADFSAARLWAERVGFEYETTLARANAQAQDIAVYLWPHNRGESA